MYQKNINAVLTHCATNTLHVWLLFHIWQINGYIPKIKPSLHFLSLFNYNQLLFAMCFFNTLKICWYINNNMLMAHGVRNIFNVLPLFHAC